MVKPNEVYSAEEIDLTAAAADRDFEGPEIPPGLVVEISTFEALDLTTANKTIRLGVKRGGSTTWFRRTAVGAAGYGLGIDTPITLVGGESPVARVESATAGDDLYFFVRGVYK